MENTSFLHYSAILHSFSDGTDQVLHQEIRVTLNYVFLHLTSVVLTYPAALLAVIFSKYGLRVSPQNVRIDTFHCPVGRPSVCSFHAALPVNACEETFGQIIERSDFCEVMTAASRKADSPGVTKTLCLFYQVTY